MQTLPQKAELGQNQNLTNDKVNNNYACRLSVNSRRNIDPLSKFPENREAMKEVLQLIKNIKQLQNKNQVAYEQVIKKNSRFFFSLYNPQIPFRIIPEQIKTTQQKLLRELDKLYEDNSDLMKELNKLNFREQNQELLKDQSISRNMNHYQFLRNIWKKQSTQNQGVQNQLQRITQNVALIRGHINLTMKKQQNFSQQQCSQKTAYGISKKYQNLLQKYECLRMLQQDHFSNQINKCFQYKESNDNNEKLQIQLHQFKQKNQQLTEKLEILEQKFLKSQCQVLSLNDKINQKEEQLSKFRKESQTKRVKVFQSCQKKFNQEEFPYQIKIFSKELLSDLGQKTKLTANLSQIIEFLESKKSQNHPQSQQKFLLLRQVDLNLSSQNEVRKSFNLDKTSLNKMIFTERYSIPKRTNLNQSIGIIKSKVIEKREVEVQVYSISRLQEDFLIRLPQTSNNLLQLEQKSQIGRQRPLLSTRQKQNELHIPQDALSINNTFSQMKFIRTNMRGNRRDSIR